MVRVSIRTSRVNFALFRCYRPLIYTRPKPAPENSECGGAAVPLSVGGDPIGPLNTVWPGPRPTCMPSFIFICPTVWPQAQTGQTHTAAVR